MNDTPKVHTSSQYGGYDNARRLDKMYADWAAASNRAEANNFDNAAQVALADALWAAYDAEEKALLKPTPRLVAVGGKHGVLEYWHEDDRSRDEFDHPDGEPFVASHPKNGY